MWVTLVYFFLCLIIFLLKPWNFRYYIVAKLDSEFPPQGFCLFSNFLMNSISFVVCGYIFSLKKTYEYNNKLTCYCIISKLGFPGLVFVSAWFSGQQVILQRLCLYTFSQTGFYLMLMNLCAVFRMLWLLFFISLPLVPPPTHHVYQLQVSQR